MEMYAVELLGYIILVVCYGAICYMCGKGDLLNLISDMLQSKANEIKDRDRCICEKCNHWHRYTKVKTDRGLCTHFMHETLEDGYCSESEEKID